MSFVPILAPMSYASRFFCVASYKARPVVRPGHVAQVRYVASCCLFACTCAITGPLRPTEAEAQTDADTHTSKERA